MSLDPLVAIAFLSFIPVPLVVIVLVLVAKASAAAFFSDFENDADNKKCHLTDREDK